MNNSINELMGFQRLKEASLIRYSLDDVSGEFNFTYSLCCYLLMEGDEVKPFKLYSVETDENYSIYCEAISLSEYNKRKENLSSNMHYQDIESCDGGLVERWYILNQNDDIQRISVFLKGGIEIHLVSGEVYSERGKSMLSSPDEMLLIFNSSKNMKLYNLNVEGCA